MNTSNETYKQWILNLMNVINDQLSDVDLMNEYNNEILLDAYNQIFDLYTMLKDNIK